MARIAKQPNGCWLWNGPIAWDGYGAFWFGFKKHIAAHRAAYVLFVGDIPKRIMVLHRCDVKACVNPDHLFLGTQQDNMDDMVRKHRHGRGEQLYNAKLTEQQVREIRNSTHSTRRLARQYGVSQHLIMRIIHRVAWKHVA